MSDIYQNIDDMIVLCQRKIELMGELKKALLLADLVGIPPKELKAKMTTRIHDAGGATSYNPKPWTKMVYSVRVGDGEWQDFPLVEVNRYLWPAETQRAWDRWQKVSAAK